MAYVHVTPLSLGIAVVGGEMLVVVPRNTKLPALKETSELTTSLDDQDSLHIQVFQGERLLVADNIPLGNFVLKGIPRALTQMRRVKVCFEVEVDGTLNVSAYDLGGGAREEITITNEFAGRLREQEIDIDRMIADAEIFRREDEERKEKNVAKYELGCCVVNMRNRARKEVSEGSLAASEGEELISSITQVVEWLLNHHDDNYDNVTVADLRDKLEELELNCSHYFQSKKMRFTHEAEGSNN